MITKEEFDKKYNGKGGIDMLLIMTKKKYLPLRTIALHFGVCAERVRQWMIEMFDWRYDPRIPRREQKIEALVDYIVKNGETNLGLVFKGMNVKYVKEAINRARVKHEEK